MAIYLAVMVEDRGGVYLYFNLKNKNNGTESRLRELIPSQIRPLGRRIPHPLSTSFFHSSFRFLISLRSRSKSLEVSYIRAKLTDSHASRRAITFCWCSFSLFMLNYSTLRVLVKFLKPIIAIN